MNNKISLNKPPAAITNNYLVEDPLSFHSRGKGQCSRDWDLFPYLFSPSTVIEHAVN